MIAVSIVCFCIILAYVAYMVWEVRRTVSKYPRKAMFMCEKHGPIADGSTFQITELTKEPIIMCPLCLDNRFKEAQVKYK